MSSYYRRRFQQRWCQLGIVEEHTQKNKTSRQLSTDHDRMVENLTRKSNTTVTIKKRIKEGNDAIYSLCVLFASLLLFCCSFGRLLLLFLTGEYPEIWRSFPIVFINTNLCLILSFDGYHLLSLSSVVVSQNSAIFSNIREIILKFPSRVCVHTR